jgi:hypothetical protein
MLRVVRTTAIKARTQAMNALHGLVVTAPDQLRADLAGLNGRQLVSCCGQLEPTPGRLIDLIDQPDTLMLAAATTALQELAQRWQYLNHQIKALDTQLAQLLPTTAPDLLASTASVSRSPANCSSPPAATPTGSPAKPPSPACAGWRPSQSAAAAPPDTGSVAAATVPPTGLSTWWSSPV